MLQYMSLCKSVDFKRYYRIVEFVFNLNLLRKTLMQLSTLSRLVEKKMFIYCIVKFSNCWFLFPHISSKTFFFVLVHATHVSVCGCTSSYHIFYLYRKQRKKSSICWKLVNKTSTHLHANTLSYVKVLQKACNYLTWISFDILLLPLLVYTLRSCNLFKLQLSHKKSAWGLSWST